MFLKCSLILALVLVVYTIERVEANAQPPVAVPSVPPASPVPPAPPASPAPSAHSAHSASPAPSAPSSRFPAALKRVWTNVWNYFNPAINSIKKAMTSKASPPKAVPPPVPAVV